MKEAGSAVVSIIDIGKDLPGAVERAMERHGVGEIVGKKPREAYVKVNAIDFKPYSFTSPEVLAQVVRFLKASGARKVFVMENSTQGNLTRLVFTVTGYRELLKKLGAEPIYLDEGKQERVSLPHMGYEVGVSKRGETRLVT